jgi:hypothetical protein
MNRIIFDHLRRWGWLWLLLALANGFCTGAFLDERNKVYGLTFQIVLWLGAMQLNFDFSRGVGRVCSSMPVTARELGRAWWILSVALPAFVLASTSALALMIYSAWSVRAFPLMEYATVAFANTVFLGMLYFFIGGVTPGWPQTPFGWVRHLTFVALLFGMMFIRPSFETPKGIFILVVGTIFTIASWFRSEETVMQRANFRQGAKTGRNAAGQHKAPGGFGGMAYLWQMLAQRLGWMMLFFGVWLVGVQLMLHKNLNFLDSPKRLLDVAGPSVFSFGFFGLFMFWQMPVMLHLRHLRALPVSTGNLAATLTLLPCLPIFGIGMAASALAGTGWQITSAALNYAAMFALSVPLNLLLGMRSGFIVSLLLVILGMMTINIFGIASAFWGQTAALAVIAISFETSRRLLQSKRKIYQIENMMPAGWNNSWNMPR